MSARAAGRSGGGRVWLLGLICGLGAALAPGLLALAGILLAPALLAFMTDPTPGRTSARPVLLLGAAAGMSPLLALNASGGGVTAAVSIGCEPRALALAWSVQGAGWLAVEAAPWLIRFMLDSTARTEAIALRRTRQSLEAEWGIPPRDEEPPA